MNNFGDENILIGQEALGFGEWEGLPTQGLKALHGQVPLQGFAHQVPESLATLLA